MSINSYQLFVAYGLAVGYIVKHNKYQVIVVFGFAQYGILLSINKCQIIVAFVLAVWYIDEQKLKSGNCCIW